MNERRVPEDLSDILPQDQARRVTKQISRLPDPGGAVRILRSFVSTNGAPPDGPVLQDFLTLAGFSPYLGGVLVGHPEFLDILASGGPGRGQRTREDLEEDLARFQFLNAGADASTVLRRFKQREYLRIALADALGTADLPSITRALSLLADVLLDKAIGMARVPLEARFGRPTSRDEHGHLVDAGFVVVGLGKLGGVELNYSSDIDLLYLFSRDGETSGVGGKGEGAITNREFFTRVATGVTGLIAGSGPEGQVFRVDLGLRPGGRDGDLVMTINAAVSYYRNWAEAWERQALVKARAVAGDLALGGRFITAVEPMIYVERPDPYATLEISALKDRIDAQLSAQGRSESDIKLGRGGIRELEFAVQALQIQNGGDDPWLRQGNTLLALHRLAEKGVIGFAQYSTLSRAYIFLRDLEHRLQLGRNRQTSTLPSSRTDFRILARRMRLFGAAPGAGGEVEQLATLLEEHRGIVRGFYDTIFSRAAQPGIGEESPALWVDRMDDSSLRKYLHESGFPDAEAVIGSVQMIGKRLQSVAVSPDIRRALRKSGALLLQTAARTPNPRRTLGSLEKLIATISPDREVLLRFLSRRELLGPIVHLLGRSDLLAGMLIRQPGILRWLEDRVNILRTPGAAEYRNAMLEAMGGRSEVTRVRASRLRRRHQESLALIAFRDVNRQATLREVLKSLSNLADATLEATVLLSADEIAERGHLRPEDPGIAVLGLGRLGYREIDYGSDLDLVFVRDTGADPVDEMTAAHRWCEGIVRNLSTLSRDGQLYKVDLRLRPSGTEGELVTGSGGLLDYFRSSAEVWEMQSFLKVRPVAGDLVLGERMVAAVQRIVLDRARALGKEGLAVAVEAMRDRLVHEAAPRGSVKLGEGGLVDIHFIIDYLRLRHSVGDPDDKDTLRLLEVLGRLGHLEAEPMRTLYEGYIFLRSLDHAMRLAYDRPLTGLPDDPARLAELAVAIDPAGEIGTAAGERLLKTFQSHTAQIKTLFEEILHGR